MYMIMHANMCYFKKNIMPSGSLGLELIHSKHTKSDQPNEPTVSSTMLLPFM